MNFILIILIQISSNLDHFWQSYEDFRFGKEIDTFRVSFFRFLKNSDDFEVEFSDEGMVLAKFWLEIWIALFKGFHMAPWKWIYVDCLDFYKRKRSRRCQQICWKSINFRFTFSTSRSISTMKKWSYTHFQYAKLKISTRGIQISNQNSPKLNGSGVITKNARPVANKNDVKRFFFKSEFELLGHF